MITNTTAKSVYTIASGVTTYAIGFSYQYNPDNTPQIMAYIKPFMDEPLTYGTDYTISPDGLSIELIDGYEVGDTLVIMRSIPMVQLSDYVIGRIDPEQIEHDFDEAVMRDQQINARMDLIGEMPFDHEERIQAIEAIIPEEATPTNQLADKQYVQDGLDTKVNANAAITGATHTKVTYDSKGLITAGEDITLADVTDITASAAEVNVLDGITASTNELNVLDGITADTTELNYVNGVTSSIQTQLDSKVDKNAAITGATKCKITYDSKGLVTAGEDIDTSDLTDVAISSVQDGEFLRYDAVAGKWKNASSSASVGFDGITGSPYDNTLLGTELTGKANTDLSNLTATGKAKCANMAMPSATYDNLTLGASGATYTAPADGYFVLAKTSTASWQTLTFYLNSCYFDNFYSFDTGIMGVLCCPVAKGDSLAINYTFGGSTDMFRFVYANGAI